MKTIDLAKKNYEKGLWSNEMLDALAAKGKINPAEVVTLKADLAKKAKK